MAEKKTEIQVFDGGVTEEQVKRWKGQHRKVARIEVEDDGEKHVGYFKTPKHGGNGRQYQGGEDRRGKVWHNPL